MHVAVLKGGLSAEREVSLTSGEAVEKALDKLGYKYTSFDVDKNIAQKLQESDVTVVFNALHGQYGEDGTIQGMLEVLQIPYTHSGVLASALAMNKPMAKQIFEQVGIRCAAGAVFKEEQMLEGDVLRRPYVIKPLNEGSSVGVCIMKEGEAYPFHEHHWPFGKEVLVEEYIPGREIQVAVLNDRALGAIEIKPKNDFYDYEAKYTDGKAEHLMPAPLEQDQYEEVLRLGLRAHQALGCRGLTRTDFRYDEREGGKWYILETNTQPGMTPLSLAPEIAAHAGISFEQLVDELIKGASLDG
ncbi:MAG: D-alanine--D-alanine ligase [Rickettsiales bacterium]|nr:D-alanine--D-alanine ligase [Rickettsiales bacterium]